MEGQDTVGLTILSQLGGAGRLRAMIGAKGFVTAPTSLQFQHMRGEGGANCTRVILDPTDTYTVEVWALVRGALKVKHTVSDVYADQLRSVVESLTGLRLSLF